MIDDLAGRAGRLARAIAPPEPDAEYDWAGRITFGVDAIYDGDPDLLAGIAARLLEALIEHLGARDVNCSSTGVETFPPPPPAPS